MVRFACKTSDSLVLSRRPNQGRSRPVTRQHHKDSDVSKSYKGKAKASAKHTSKARRESRHEHAIRAAAKFAAKSKAPPTTNSFVYVGNLQAGVTEDQLRSIFAKCGTILKVHIRCSGGQVITVGTPIPEHIRTSRDRQYASIEFIGSSGGKRALRKNGHVFEGMPLVVTTSAANLPEVQDIINYRIERMQEEASPKKALLADKDERNFGRTPLMSYFRRKPLQPDATQILTEKGTSGADKVRFMGFSFAPTVI